MKKVGEVFPPLDIDLFSLALSSSDNQIDHPSAPETVTTHDFDADEDLDPEELLIVQKWKRYNGNAWESIGAAVDVLIELTAMVRKSTVSVGDSILHTTFHRTDDYFSDYAKTLTRRWFQDARKSLTDQLGEAIFIRRRHILYRMKHEEKIIYPRTGAWTSTSIKSTEPVTVHPVTADAFPETKPRPTTTIPVFGASAPSSTNVSEFQKERFKRRQGRHGALSGISEGSISTTETSFSYMYPEPPKLGDERYTTCPYCLMILNSNDLNEGAWRLDISSNSKSSIDRYVNVYLGSIFMETFDHMYAYQKSVKVRCDYSRIPTNG